MLGGTKLDEVDDVEGGTELGEPDDVEGGTELDELDAAKVQFRCA